MGENLTTVDFVTDLERRLELRQELSKGIPFAGALVSFALARGAASTTRWELITCRWEFVEEARESRPMLDYHEALIGELFVPETECLRHLRGIAGKHLEFGSITVPFQAQSVYLSRGVGRRSRYTRWSEWVYEISGSPEAGTPEGPLLRVGLRPYNTGPEAIIDCIWPEIGRERCAERADAGQFVVIMPDTRARLLRAEWSGDSVLVRIQRNVGADTLELQGVFWPQGDGRAVWLAERGPSDEVVWTVPPDTQRIDLFLLHRSGEQAGRVDLRRIGQVYDALDRPLAASDRAEVDLARGEHEEVAFLPFSLPGRDEGWVVETVIAMANTNGGRIYLGVADDGTLEGEAGLRKATKGKGAAAFRAWLETLEEKTKPTPEVEIVPLTLWGDPVVLLRVGRGAGGPYSTRDNCIWVRSGSTNKRPDPRSELPRLYQRSPLLA